MEIKNLAQTPVLHANHPIDGDEKAIRHKLVHVWTKVLEKYAQPLVQIPSVEEVRQELLDCGVKAAVKVVTERHWFVFEWMVIDDIRRKVQQGLNRFDLEQFVENVRIAQYDPEMLQALRREVEYNVLFES